MANKIPPYSETFEKIRNAGYTKEDIESAVKKVADEIGEFVSNKDYHIFIVAQNLGVDIGEVRFISSIRPYKINEINLNTFQIEMRGYVVSVEKRKTLKGKESLRLTIADETGVAVIRIFGGEMEGFEKLKRGDYIHISPVRVEEYPKDSGKINLTAFGGCSIKTIEPDISIDDFVPSVEKAKEGQLVHVKGIVLEQKDGRSYLGCSICKRSFGNSEIEGEEAVCPFCGGRSVVTKFVSNSIAVASGDDTVICILSPFMEVPKNLNGSAVDVWGTFSEQWNRVDIISIDVIKPNILQPVESYIEKKDTPKKDDSKKRIKKTKSVEVKKEAKEQKKEKWVDEMIATVDLLGTILKKSLVESVSGKNKISHEVVEKKIRDLCDDEVLREKDGYVSRF